MPTATYATLLRTPGAAAFFLTASAGRVGIAMTSLGMVWLVQARTGSYAVAGLVTGGLAVAEAVVGPQLARLVDRYGQSRVLPPVLVAHAASVTALLLLLAAGAPPWLLTAGGVAAGASLPQLGALSAARWAALLRRDPAALPTAFSLESVSNGTAYLVGPVLVSAVAASGRPELGAAGAAALVVAGGLALAAQRRTAPRPASRGAAAGDSPDGGSAGRRLLRPAFGVLVAVGTATGVYFGALTVSVTAFAVERGTPGVATVLFGVSSGAGLLAAWAYGTRRWRTAPSAQLAVATAALALGCLPLLVVDSALGMGVVLAVTGAAIPPVLVLCAVLAEARVHRSVLTQAFTWQHCASAAGTAGAAAVSGRAVDAFAAPGGFAVVVAAAAAMALLAVGGSRVLGDH